MFGFGRSRRPAAPQGAQNQNQGQFGQPQEEFQQPNQVQPRNGGINGGAPPQQPIPVNLGGQHWGNFNPAMQGGIGPGQQMGPDPSKFGNPKAQATQNAILPKTLPSTDRATIEAQVREEYTKRGLPVDESSVQYFTDKASKPDVFSDGKIRVGWNPYWAARMINKSGSEDPRLAGEDGVIGQAPPSGPSANPMAFGLMAMNGMPMGFGGMPTGFDSGSDQAPPPRQNDMTWLQNFLASMGVKQ